MAADQEQKYDERDGEYAEAGPEVEVGEPPALLCDLNRLNESLKLLDGHLDAKT